jgi:hypothetical protein
MMADQESRYKPVLYENFTSRRAHADRATPAGFIRDLVLSMDAILRGQRRRVRSDVQDVVGVHVRDDHLHL